MDEDNFIKQQIGLRVKKYEYRDRFAARYLKQYSKASFHSFLILKLISKVRRAMLVGTSFNKTFRYVFHKTHLLN